MHAASEVLSTKTEQEIGQIRRVAVGHLKSLDSVRAGWLGLNWRPEDAGNLAVCF